MQRRIVERAVVAAEVGGNPADRRPGLGQDAVLRVETLEGRLLEVRMHFDPVDGRHDGRFRKQATEVVGHEVADAMARTFPSACNFSSAR